MSSNIEWRVIPGFSRYSASSTGQLRRDVRMHNSMPGPIAQSLDQHGYWAASLTDDDGEQRKHQVHRFVAMAFFGDPPAGLVVCHGKAGKSVNAVRNLRYDTYAANTEDSRRDGTMVLGDRAPGAKLTEADVVAIHARCCAGAKQADVAAEYGVSQGAVANIMRRHSWISVALVRGPGRGITDDMLVQAAEALRAGSSLRAAAAEIGVTHPGLKAALQRHPAHADLFEFRDAKAAKRERAAA